jgi:hypothetical protein
VTRTPAGCHTIRRRLEVDQEASFDDVEELVVCIVPVPVILALYHGEPHDGLVHARQRLIVPRVAYGGDERVERDLLQRREEHVEMRGIREHGRRGGLILGHRRSSCGLLILRRGPMRG